MIKIGPALIKDFENEIKAGPIEVEFTLDEIEELAFICNFAMIKAFYGSEIYNDALEFGATFFAFI